MHSGLDELVLVFYLSCHLISELLLLLFFELLTDLTLIIDNVNSAVYVTKQHNHTSVGVTA